MAVDRRVRILSDLGLDHVLDAVVPQRGGLDGLGHLGHSFWPAAAAPAIVDGRYSTSSWVSSMNASSKDAVIGVSSWTRRPSRAARSPICGAVSPSTVSDPPSPSPTLAPPR